MYVVMSNETSVSFQFDFDWQHHSESCDDCRALFRTITHNGSEGIDNNITCYAFVNGKFKIVDFFRFGDANDQEQGHLSFTARPENFKEVGKYTNPNESLDITRLRLTLLSLEPGALEAEKLISDFTGIPIGVITGIVLKSKIKCSLSDSSSLEISAVIKLDAVVALD